MGGGGSGVSVWGDMTPGNPDPSKAINPATGTPDWGRGAWSQGTGFSDALGPLMGGSAQDPLGTFASSPEGKSIDPTVIAAIRNGKNETDENGRVWAKINGSIVEISSQINQYKAWAAANTDAASAFAAYQNLAKGQPGRDATLLTGATVAPQTAVGQVYPAGAGTVVGQLAPSVGQGITRRQI